MKISLVCPDLSGNGVGRAFVLARVLGRHHDVEVVGAEFGDGVWTPVADAGVAYRAVPMERTSRGVLRFGRLVEAIDGDLILASKPLPTSYGAALVARAVRRRPLILDIDDWESGFRRQSFAVLDWGARLRHLVGSTLRPHTVHGFWGPWILEALARRADAVTVSNRFLQQRFGGEIVWHGRDTASMRPDAVDVADARRSAGLEPGARAVIFFGTVQAYKGVDDLIDAVASIAAPELRLLLVGIGDDPGSIAAAERARAVLGARARCVGRQPFGEVPRWLAAADVVVVPQRSTPATVGQMPAKLFDAMAMGRPIVATAVGDIPLVLGGCGWIVPPGDPAALARALGEALASPARAAELGARARARCEERFGWDAMQRTLERVVDAASAR